MKLGLARGIVVGVILASGAGAWAQAEDEPPAPPPPPAPAVVAAPKAPEVVYAAGTRLRGIFVPTWFLNAFMKHSHPLNSIAWGAEFTRRKGNLDIVVALDVGWYGNIDQANWVGTGDWVTDNYKTWFTKFVFTSIDINWIWHHDFTDWLALRYGGGIGIGFLSGDMWRQLSSGPNCTQSTVDDQTKCIPGGPANTYAPFTEDLSSYRVLPVVSALLGLRFTVNRHAVITVDGGFHDAFFFGAGGQYVF